MEIKRVNLTFQDELVSLEKVNKLIIHHTAEDGWDVYKTHEFHQTVRGGAELVTTILSKRMEL